MNKKYLAEFLAVFFVVLVAAGAIVADQELSVVQVRDSFGPLGIALAYGLVYGIVLAALGGVTQGYANPAISLALYIARRISAKDLGGYLIADVVGAILAGLLVTRLFPRDAVEAVGAGVPALGPSTTLVQGGVIEIVLTFVLVFVVWSAAAEGVQTGRRGPLTVGLTLLVGVLAGAPFTGGVMNPARWLGPAVASAQFGNWPVWILGPIVGALMASAAYELFFVGGEGEEGLQRQAEPVAPTRTTSTLPEEAGEAGRPEASSPAAHAAADEELPSTGEAPQDHPGAKQRSTS